MPRPRTTPVLLGEHEGEIPQRVVSGFWQTQMEETFKPNPGKVFVFGSVSPSTATNLRRDYGLDAYTHTEGDETKLYVKWDPDRAEQIKADVKARGEKRKATIEANKQNGDTNKGKGKVAAPAR